MEVHAATRTRCCAATRSARSATAARHHPRPGDAAVARRDREHQGRPQRELRARGAWSCSRSARIAAYTEKDVRELARAFTGWRATWTDPDGWVNFRYDPTATTRATRRVFGQTGSYDWQDGVRPLPAQPFHPSFFVTKLWGYFVPTPPARRRAALQRHLRVQRVGTSPGGPRDPAPPAPVRPGAHDQAAGGAGRRDAARDRPRIDTTAWSWLCDGPARSCSSRRTSRAGTTGAGWTRRACAGAGTWRELRDARQNSDPWDDAHPYDPAEDRPTALARALQRSAPGADRRDAMRCSRTPTRCCRW